MVYTKVDELIGNTPLMELKNIEKSLGLKASLFAKLEFLNPTGSAKDRAALSILNSAEKNGLIGPGGVVVEATSGNTGIGLASVAASRGYKAVIIMPDSMSKERIKLMQAYGAEVVLSDGSKGMQGSLEKLNEVKEKYPGCFVAGQFVNPANAEAHYLTTGPEIFNDLDGMVDTFVAGVGTGGTLSGTGKYLKEKIGSIEIVAVEPLTSPLLSKGFAGPHGLQGIGANFIPEILDAEIIDRIMCISDEDAYECARLIGKQEGLMVGISSGAALSAAIELCKDEAYANKNIVVLLPDSGDRYLSTTLFGE